MFLPAACGIPRFSAMRPVMGEQPKTGIKTIYEKDIDIGLHGRLPAGQHDGSGW